MTPKYRVQIGPVERARPEYWPGCNYSVTCSKLYGDLLGRSTCVATKQDVIDLFQRIRQEWEAFDSILDRMGDKVTPTNLWLEDKTESVTKEELLGNFTARLI